MVDILIKNGFLLTMQGSGVGTIEDGAIAIEENDIVAVGKTHELKKKYGIAERVIDASGKAILPGFVDGHIHTSLCLLRGEAQDVPEIEWMLKTMAPFMRFFKPTHRVKGAALGVLEAMKAGTTTFGEIGENMNLIAERVFAPAGVRANLATTINEIGPDSRPDPNKLYIFDQEVGKRKFNDALSFVEKWKGRGDGSGLEQPDPDRNGLFVHLGLQNDDRRIGGRIHGQPRYTHLMQHNNSLLSHLRLRCQPSPVYPATNGNTLFQFEHRAICPEKPRPGLHHCDRSQS